MTRSESLVFRGRTLDPRTLDRVASAGAVGLSAGLWAVGMATLDLGDVSDLGLAPAIPVPALVGLGLLCVSFAFALRRDLGRWFMVLHVVALTVMLFAIPAVVEPLPRFNVAWRHVGITEVLLRTGIIDPRIDAYFSWPGFFAASALITEVTGLESTLDLVAWAPVAFNLLYLPPLLLILRAATTDRTVVWLGVWIFYLGNWIGQDYYAPQAYGYFIHLLIIGLLLTYFRDDRPPMWPIPRRLFTPPIRPRPQLGPLQRAGLLAVIMIMFGVLSASHQLSPFALIATVMALAVLGRITVSSLPAALAVILGSWISYMTVTYLQGHLPDLVERIGAVDTTVAANLTDRFRGSPGHLAVITVRSLTTVALWGLAGIGSLLLVRRNPIDLTVTLLAATPFALLLLQPYGGEMLLRVYLFSLPFVSLLAASALLAYARPSLSRLPAVVVAASVVFMGTFLISRYGNERMDHITVAEAAGMERLYEIAPLDSQLVALTSNVFWRYRDYERYHHLVATESVVDLDVPGIVRAMRARSGAPGFLVVSRVQFAALQLVHSVPDGQWDELKRQLEATAGVSVAYENPDITIYKTEPTR